MVQKITTFGDSLSPKFLDHWESSNNYIDLLLYYHFLEMEGKRKDINPMKDHFLM